MKLTEPDLQDCEVKQLPKLYTVPLNAMTVHMVNAWIPQNFDTPYKQNYLLNDTSRVVPLWVRLDVEISIGYLENKE